MSASNLGSTNEFSVRVNDALDHTPGHSLIGVDKVPVLRKRLSTFLTAIPSVFVNIGEFRVRNPC